MNGIKNTMSDDEETINPVAHKQLLKGISSLGKTQYIRKPTRDEPTLQHDEFHLIKSTHSEIKAHQPVTVNDVVAILKDTEEHLNIGKKLRNVVRTKKVLKKPLEKPVAERIKRSLGYENVKKRLSRWDALVAKNRSAEQQVFPLQSETIYINTSGRRKKDLALKSDLMKQMEEANKKLAAIKRQKIGDMEDPGDLEEKRRVLLEKQLTHEEFEAKRKELAYLKMRQSQKSAKARMQNKIKSKKYHKLLKRQKLQQQLKEFELLQKSNPEAALEKLNALEKARALERASLRHKNTGTWAKNLQVRAKYDKEVRKDLAEQLQKSRELTEKVKDMQSDEDEDDEHDEVAENDHKLSTNDNTKEEEEQDPLNPWIKVIKKSNEGVSNGKELGNWRQFWLEKNNNEKLLEEYKKLLHQTNEISEKRKEDEKDIKIEPEKCVKSEGNRTDQEKPEESSTIERISTQNSTEKLKKQRRKIIEKRRNDVNKIEKSNKRKCFWENGWLVEELDSTKECKKVKNDVKKDAEKEEEEEVRDVVDETLDNIFDTGEERIREKLHKKLEELNEKVKHYNQRKSFTKSQNEEEKPETEEDPLSNLNDLTFQENENKRPIIDEELINNEIEMADKSNNKNKEILKLIQKTSSIKANGQQTTNNKENCSTSHFEDHIDPKNFLDFKLKRHHHLNDFTAINNVIGEVDIDDDVDDEEYLKQQTITIAEAFEDDDIIADFNQEKTEESQSKNTELDLSMPGWGSWAGPGLSTTDKQQSSNKHKRLILKLAPPEKRRDENKNNVYINEETSKQLRQHLVSDIPFPFTTQQDYEASIRAPIGRDFVTETSFRMLTRPSVITRKGQIIEPMDESELLKKPRKLKNPVDIRIAQLNKTL